MGNGDVAFFPTFYQMGGRLNNDMAGYIFYVPLYS